MPLSENVGIVVHIQNDRPAGVLSAVAGHGVPLIRRDALPVLGERNVSEQLVLGRVFNKFGQEIENWATFRARMRLIVRGTKNVGFRKCDLCGRSIYFAMGKRYLCPMPKEPERLFESHLRGLVLPEKIYITAESEIKKWRGIQLDRLSVLDLPRDGLPREL
jgi:hypothetical protein